MTCRTIAPLLSAFVDGQLSQEQAARVRAHVDACARCRQDLLALQAVTGQLASLKSSASAAMAPAGVLAGLRSLPEWVVRLAVLRRWLMAAGAIAACGGVGLLVLRWSGPLPATLAARATQQETAQLTVGTTLLAQPGETVAITLPRQAGTLTLRGPGGLVVREAALGKVRHDQRLTLEVPAGQLEVKIAPGSPMHDIRLLTPQATIRLHGTWVLLTAGAASTQLAVLEGDAWLKGVATPRSIRLRQGQVAQVTAGWLSVGQIPLEEWLARKGLAPSAPPPQESAPNSTTPPSPTLQYEQPGS